MDNSATTRPLVIAAVLLLSAVSASWMLTQRTLDSHECFVSVTAREMLQCSNWVMPTCNGRLRINKTPLPYWLVAGLAKITGKVDEFSARLPSAIFAFLSAMVILYFVNQWLSFRIAVISTALWATSLAYIHCSHSARPDMAMAFFTTLSLLSFYSAATAADRSRQIIYAIVFWISFALANLAKGPAPIPYVLIPLAGYIVAFRQWKTLPKLLPVAGPLIFLLIVLPWPLAVAQKVNWDILIWKREFIDRLFGDYAPGKYPVFYYLLIIFKYVTPWVAFLPLALTAPFFEVWQRKQPVMKFLWLWFVLDLLFLTIDAGKRQHYILPAMPAMAVLIGILLEDLVFEHKAYDRNFAKIFFLGHLIAIVAGMSGAAVYLAVVKPQLREVLLVLCVITMVSAALVTLLLAGNKPAPACVLIFAAVTLWFMVAFPVFSPFFSQDVPSRRFAESIARIVPRSENLVAYGDASTRFVQYFGRTVPEMHEKSLLNDHYEKGDWIIALSGSLEELEKEGCAFRKIYSRQTTPGRGKEDSGGAIFHKSAPIPPEPLTSRLHRKGNE